MHGQSIQVQTAAIEVLPLAPRPPAWADALVASDPEFSLLSVDLPDPPSPSAAALAASAASLYDSLGRDLAQASRHAVRIWNFVPDIQGAIDGAGDRYMAFNMGRFDAYCRWFGDPATFRRALPTSSAVGVEGASLSVHVLAATAPGRPVENPRQIPAYRYSRRFGARPPCFARATRVGSRLFIGGTASILGEDSYHGDSIERQTRETIRNLEALIRHSGLGAGAPLDRLTSLRVHVRDAADAPQVRAMIERFAPHVRDVEFVQAFLCRRELLVEIEGTAE